MKRFLRPVLAVASLVTAFLNTLQAARAETVGLSFTLAPSKALSPAEPIAPAKMLPPPTEPSPAPVAEPAESALPVPDYPPVGSPDSQFFAALPPPPPLPPEMIATGAEQAVVPAPEPDPAPAPEPDSSKPIDTQIGLDFEPTDIASTVAADRPQEPDPQAELMMAKAAVPAIAPQLTAAAREAYLFTGGSESLVAKAVGHAEGTRAANGSRTSAYYGHVDPGNGVWNLGSFSYQHGARSPEEADELQLKRLKGQYQVLQQQAVGLGLTLTLQEELNGIDLANQAPIAALGPEGYMDWLARAYSLGMRGSEAVLWARTRSFLDPDTQRWNAPGLGNTVYGISHDQERRMMAIARVMEQSPLPTPIHPVVVESPDVPPVVATVDPPGSLSETLQVDRQPNVKPDIGVKLFGDDVAHQPEQPTETKSVSQAPALSLATEPVAVAPTALTPEDAIADQIIFYDAADPELPESPITLKYLGGKGAS